jgi:putative oxidoreductase
MKTITSVYKDGADYLNKFQDISLFALRLLLAYCFYEPATMKWQDIDEVISYFSSMGFPLPLLSAYIVAGIEASAVILLTLGFGVRLISLLSIIVMIVAMLTVHWKNGFSVTNNGVEILLYYSTMLLVLLTFGAGKLSIDHLFRKKYL